MLHRFATLTGVVCLSAMCLQAQGLNTNASKDDWEEINFEFNSAVLSDGYPSLLRLADLLKNNSGYRVRVEGNTDNLGGDRANERLGLERANTVRDFLVKYGARAEQIETASRGKSNPEVHGYKRRYSKTDVARWMNRRVVLTVTDQNGKTVSAAGVGEAIKGIEQSPGACCQDILKRLDKLDEIAQMLKDMAAQNAGLKQQVADLQQREQALEDQVRNAPKPLTGTQTAAVVDQRLEKFRDPRFSLLAFNVGRDTFNDYLTVNASGRFFAPFKDHFAFQAQGEYMYFHVWHEAQLDFGLVDRIGQAQVGAFASFKHVDLAGYQSGGNLGQAAITYDFLFGRGKVGVFGTKSFLSGAVINNVNSTFTDVNGNLQTAPNLFQETTINVVDTAGLSTTLGLWGRTYLEANVGGLRSAGHGGRAGGSGKLVFPLADRLAFTIGGGFNETLLDRHNWGSITAGVQVGNFIRPKDYLATNRPVPVDIPRIHWELLNRTVTRGATPPHADAGPDQLGVPAGTITLNGSRSYDPNGLALTYQWIQEGGPAVALSGANTAVARFSAQSGQSYSFLLTVRNTAGLTGTARTRVTISQPEKAIILFFSANPSTINSGQSSTLSWSTQFATKVSISGVGNNLPASGSQVVSPKTNTTYTLTASNAISSQTATAAVNVGFGQQQPMIVIFNANPSTISQGESSTLSWEVQNATKVTISPTVGNVAENGNSSVSPSTTTAYTITATNASGQTATASATVTVSSLPPSITSFTAAPSTITTAGGSSVLTCDATHATSVVITGGSVSGATGSSSATTTVTPGATTVYTCTAKGSAGSTTQTVTVNVNSGGPSSITSFTATPSTITTAGGMSTLACNATGTTSVTITGTGVSNATGATSATTVVTPSATTTYTCTAIGSQGTSTQNVTVTVNTGAPIISVAGGPLLVVYSPTVFIDLTATVSPTNAYPLTYSTTPGDNLGSTVVNGNTATPQLNIKPIFNQSYLFNITVTDAKGRKSTYVVTVLYQGPNA